MDRQEKKGAGKIINAGKKNGAKKVLFKNVSCMLLTLLSITLTAFAGSVFVGLDLYYTARNLVFCACAALVTVFSFQAGRISGSFFYDDGEYPGRFLAV